MPYSLTQLARYPVKSCRGEQLERVTVERPGLAGDRRWMLVDPDGVLRTAREFPRLVLATPRHTGYGGLHVTFPDTEDLLVPPATGALTSVRVWKSELKATLADDAAHAWFSAIAGVDTRLVYLDDPGRRRPNPLFSRADDRVAFNDGYPLLMINQASLDALNDAIVTGRHADEGPLPVTRFRPNLVVRGGGAWEEDGWRRVRVGDAFFRAVKGCDRCSLTLVDPVTAAKGKEPIATLARIRRFDGATWFGMQLIPDNPGATIAVGDDVEILESVDAPEGPPR